MGLIEDLRDHAADLPGLAADAPRPAPLAVALLSLPPRSHALLAFFFDNAGRGSYVEAPEAEAQAAIVDLDTPASREHWQRFAAERRRPGLALAVQEPAPLPPDTTWVRKPVTPAALLAVAGTLREAARSVDAHAAAHAAPPVPADDGTTSAGPGTGEAESEPGAAWPAGDAVDGPDGVGTPDAAPVEALGAPGLPTRRGADDGAAPRPARDAASEDAVQALLDAALGLRPSAAQDPAAARPDDGDDDNKGDVDRGATRRATTGHPAAPIPTAPALDSPGAGGPDLATDASIAVPQPDGDAVPEATVPGSPAAPAARTAPDGWTARLRRWLQGGIGRPGPVAATTAPDPSGPDAAPPAPTTAAGPALRPPHDEPHDEPGPVSTGPTGPMPTVEPVTTAATPAPAARDDAGSAPVDAPATADAGGDPAPSPDVPALAEACGPAGADGRPPSDVHAAADAPAPRMTTDPPADAGADAGAETGAETIVETVAATDTATPVATDVPTDAPSTLRATATPPVAPPVADPAWFGDRPDLGPAELATDPSRRYDPESWLCGVLREAFLVSSRWQVPARVDTPAGPLVVVAARNALHAAFDDPSLVALADAPLASRPKVHTLTDADCDAFVSAHADAAAARRLDAELWRAALHAGRGRLPAAVDPRRVTFLRQWPNLTRLPALPHAMRLAALWAVRGASVVDAARTLGVPQREVIAFVNACWALNLLTDDGSHLRRAQRRAAHPRSLLGRLLGWLRT